MGMAATSRATSPDVVATDAHRTAEPATAGEMDVDDVRMLLRELRLRRQLREQG
jgi:hypothetical protein